ncbi:MAG: hypothetical protein DMD79_21065 [Candidatus Rokuibacteriota bacterium]|nr:MAG: hypothetical protein DMD79_21065 [Candidatus Rokubacteria bacterium]
MSPAGLFALLWASLADLLGTAATAALLRRAAKRAQPMCPELSGMVIALSGLSYDYRLPESWARQGDGQALTALRRLAVELRPLLIELAGPVVIRRLDRLTVLKEHGIEFVKEGQP